MFLVQASHNFTQLIKSLQFSVPACTVLFNLSSYKRCSKSLSICAALYLLQIGFVILRQRRQNYIKHSGCERIVQMYTIHNYAHLLSLSMSNYYKNSVFFSHLHKPGAKLFIKLLMVTPDVFSEWQLIQDPLLWLCSPLPSAVFGFIESLFVIVLPSLQESGNLCFTVSFFLPTPSN